MCMFVCMRMYLYVCVCMCTPGLRYKIPVFSDPAPGENILSGNLVMETGGMYVCVCMYMYACMYGWMDGSMDLWIQT